MFAPNNPVARCGKQKLIELKICGYQCSWGISTSLSTDDKARQKISKDREEFNTSYLQDLSDIYRSAPYPLGYVQEETRNSTEPRTCLYFPVHTHL